MCDFRPICSPLFRCSVNMAGKEPQNKVSKRIEDSHVAQSRSVILIVDYGSQYTQLITRRYGNGARACLSL